MDIRQITPRYFVSPQISAEDIPAVVAAGISTVICNRPDAEIPPSHHALALKATAEAAGLTFVVNPLTHDTMTPDRLALQRDTLEQSDGKVLAYCASGTRSTVAWCLGHAKSIPVDDILGAAQSGGYALDALRPTLEQIAAS
ncbi:TIGR01244 family phosphatase [Shimia litoralis]|uniref:TIGR01244 family phosphatase n=1 Tax=Shimia litoralis TaxID=420403 RepID=A0A4U7N645_9RHOB|nr:TIGR01244 family sulfur transferase [Shimia litoralis]TKZ21339.1 TIGR01244 family phosphatase [Shimia litoralis]